MFYGRQQVIFFFFVLAQNSVCMLLCGMIMRKQNLKSYLGKVVLEDKGG